MCNGLNSSSVNLLTALQRQVAVRIMYKALLPTLDSPPGPVLIVALFVDTLGLSFSVYHEGLVFDGTGRRMSHICSHICSQVCSHGTWQSFMRRGGMN